MSIACARGGATVVLHGRIVRKLEALYDEIVGQTLPEPVILPLDLARAEASDQAASLAMQDAGEGMSALLEKRKPEFTGR